MKAILSFVFVFMVSSAAFSQQSPGEALAEKIAVRMKDSLQLTDLQKAQLYNANLQLHNLKQEQRQKYTGTDSLRFYVQKVENTRDFLYQAILPADKYLLYREKKAVLVNNN